MSGAGPFPSVQVRAAGRPNKPSAPHVYPADTNKLLFLCKYFPVLMIADKSVTRAQ